MPRAGHALYTWFMNRYRVKAAAAFKPSSIRLTSACKRQAKSTPGGKRVCV
jgi:hypothetical protein